jgi:hypothetical protein
MYGLTFRKAVMLCFHPLPYIQWPPSVYFWHLCTWGFIYLFFTEIFFKKNCLFIFLFIYSHVHTLFGSILPPVPHPIFPSPQFQAGPVLPSSLILLKKRHMYNKNDKAFLLVEFRVFHCVQCTWGFKQCNVHNDTWLFWVTVACCYSSHLLFFCQQLLNFLGIYTTLWLPFIVIKGEGSTKLQSWCTGQNYFIVFTCPLKGVLWLRVLILQWISILTSFLTLKVTAQVLPP